VETLAAEGSDAALREDARRALAALPWKYRSALLLHHVQGLSVDHTARVLGCRAGTVKSRLARARAQMLEELRRQENER
jgi:RNA polymerase sigma-70 factor (ECF subfamily)